MTLCPSNGAQLEDTRTQSGYKFKVILSYCIRNFNNWTCHGISNNVFFVYVCGFYYSSLSYAYDKYK